MENQQESAGERRCAGDVAPRLRLDEPGAAFVACQSSCRAILMISDKSSLGLPTHSPTKGVGCGIGENAFCSQVFATGEGRGRGHAGDRAFTKTDITYPRAGHDAL